MMKKNMEHDFLKKGIRALQEIRISPEEKGAVLTRLMEHAAQHPALIVSPWRVYVSRFRFHSALASLLIMVLAGGSVVSAAEGALPGDLLYPVKLNVTEPLQGALISGDVSRAHWEAKKTVRRLEEAETLAAQGRLTEATVQTVKDNFQKSVNEFNATIRSAGEKTTSVELVNATIDFEADIRAHSQILAVVGNAATSSLANDIASLQSSVDDSAHKAKEQRVRASASGEGHGRETFNDRVQEVQTMINTTEVQLKDAAISVDTNSSSVQRDILENSAQSLQTAEDALEEAKQKRDSGDSDEAFSALLDSQSAVKQADTSLQQGLKFGKEEKKRRDSSGRGDDSDRGDSSGRGSGPGRGDNSGRD